MHVFTHVYGYTDFDFASFILFPYLLSLVRVSCMAGYFSLNFSLISFLRVDGFT